MAFLERAAALLYRDEPTNSLMLGLCDNMLRAKEAPKQPSVFIRILKDRRIAAAAVRIPPGNLVLTHASTEELDFLADHLKKTGAAFPGVIGPAREAETFSAIWAPLSGSKATLGMRQRIYRIDQVRTPDTPGNLRLARTDEIDTLSQWLVAFADESLPPHERKSFEVRRLDAARAIERQLAYFWTVEDKPVSMAHVSRHTRSGVSINAVYTPKSQRKNGFASAGVAHLSQKMLDLGKKFCVLYADLSNPTSNRIYQDIGYKAVTDSKYFVFERDDAAYSHPGSKEPQSLTIGGRA